MHGQPLTDCDVLVVGAGPTGLALAAHLVALGVTPRVIDRAPDRVHESRALAIQPRTLEVLAGLGVVEELLARGNPAVRLRLHVRGRDLVMPLFDLGLDDTAYPYLLFVSQAETERILDRHLATAGVTVERCVELVHLAATPPGATATLRHDDGRQEHLSARYVVGCDGAHSTVRRAAGIAFEGSAYPQTFVLADLEADGIQPGAAHVFASGRGMLFLFPLGAPATWRLLAMRPPTDHVSAGTPVTLDEVQALADAYTETAVPLRDPVWMTNFRVHHRGASRYRAGPLFLAGDAAHIHSPAGAQGMNTGIQDATNLAWKLAYTVRGLADPAVLDTYEPERAPVGRTVLRFTDRAYIIATSTNPMARFARTRIAPALLPLALRYRPGRAYAFRTVSQLGIQYRTSPLSVDGTPARRHGPHAGDRLPDAPVIHNGRTSSLHTAIAAPGWHLLVCTGTDTTADPPVRLDGHRAGLITVHHLSTSDHTVREESGGMRAPDGQASRRLGLSPGGSALYLVRPDGYIGYRAAGTDPSGLTRYLDRWLTT